jgi:hypothetical protein
MVVPTQSSTSSLKEFSELLDHLPIESCVELTRRLLTSISSLHRGSTPAGCLEDRYFLRGRIREHDIERFSIKPCASPAGTRSARQEA